MPESMEAGLMRIIEGFKRNIRYTDPISRPGFECLFPEDVEDHVFKLGIIMQCLIYLVRIHDPEKFVEGEILLALVFDHDIGETHPNDHDKLAPIKTGLDESNERMHYREMISFLPEGLRSHFVRIHDHQLHFTVTRRLFHAAELAQRLFYVVNEIVSENPHHDILWQIFCDIWDEIQPYIKEFNGLRVLLEPIQQFVNLIRTTTPDEP